MDALDEGVIPLLDVIDASLEEIGYHDYDDELTRCEGELLDIRLGLEAIRENDGINRDLATSLENYLPDDVNLTGFTRTYTHTQLTPVVASLEAGGGNIFVRIGTAIANIISRIIDWLFGRSSGGSPTESAKAAATQAEDISEKVGDKPPNPYAIKSIGEQIKDDKKELKDLESSSDSEGDKRKRELEEAIEALEERKSAAEKQLGIVERIDEKVNDRRDNRWNALTQACAYTPTQPMVGFVVAEGAIYEGRTLLKRIQSTMDAILTFKDPSIVRNAVTGLNTFSRQAAEDMGYSDHTLGEALTGFKTHLDMLEGETTEPFSIVDYQCAMADGSTHPGLTNYFTYHFKPSGGEEETNPDSHRGRGLEKELKRLKKDFDKLNKTLERKNGDLPPDLAAMNQEAFQKIGTAIKDIGQYLTIRQGLFSKEKYFLNLIKVYRNAL